MESLALLTIRFRVAQMDEHDPVELPIEDSLDLHAFAPKDVKPVVEAYLEEVYSRGFPVVRIIHGRGIGAQREIVRSVLTRSRYVSAFQDAPPQAGGWGATVVAIMRSAPRSTP